MNEDKLLALSIDFKNSKINADILRNEMLDEDYIKAFSEKLKMEGSEILLLTEPQVQNLIETFVSFLDARLMSKTFITPEDVKKLKISICESFDIPDVEMLNSLTRKREVVLARQLLLSILYQDNYGSLEKVAAEVGKKHASTIHSMKVIQNMIDTQDKKYYKAIERIVIQYNLFKKFKIKREVL